MEIKKRSDLNAFLLYKFFINVIPMSGKSLDIVKEMIYSIDAETERERIGR